MNTLIYNSGNGQKMNIESYQSCQIVFTHVPDNCYKDRKGFDQLDLIDLLATVQIDILKHEEEFPDNKIEYDFCIGSEVPTRLIIILCKEYGIIKKCCVFSENSNAKIMTGDTVLFSIN